MDSKDKTGKADRDRINLSEKYEIEYWTKRFGVTEQELRKAVSEVGEMVKNVEEIITEMKKSQK